MFPALCLLVFLAACNPQGLRPVDDTGSTDDTGQPGQLLAIHADPGRVVVPLGGEVRLVASGVFEGRVSADVTAEAVWLSDDRAVAAPDDSDGGRVAGLSAGTTEVFATLDGVRSRPVEVTVTDAALVGLSLHPAALALAGGAQAQVHCQGAFADGARGDVSHQVQWTSDDDGVATVDGGRVWVVSTGDTTLTASWEGRQVQAALAAFDGEADLSIAGVQARTGPDAATVAVTLANDGTVGAPAFWLDLFVDPAAEPGPGELGDDYHRVSWLGPGESTERLFAFPVAAGDHTAWFALDWGDEVPEADEADNLDATPFTVGGSAGGPDLTVASFAYYADDSWVFYAVDVRNDGTADVGAFWLDLWVDAATDPTASGIGDAFVRVDGLAPGAAAQADFVIEASAVSCSACTSWVVIDINGQVGETDETDNLAGPLPVTVP